MFLDYIFPKKCLGCGFEGKYICKLCLQKAKLGKRNNQNFAIFKYEGVIKRIIVSLKYKFAYDVSNELVNICALNLRETKLGDLKNIVLIPIPLSARRKNWRGFNQSEIIGEEIATKMGWKYISNLLIKNKDTTPQISLKGSERRKNLNGVFTVNIGKIKDIEHSLLLIFDDVYTTGSTILEAKKELKRKGFKKIYSLTIAC